VERRPVSLAVDKIIEEVTKAAASQPPGRAQRPRKRHTDPRSLPRFMRRENDSTRPIRRAQEPMTRSAHWSDRGTIIPPSAEWQRRFEGLEARRYAERPCSLRSTERPVGRAHERVAVTT
jgi:hypothetical protein